jgi:predicted PurR-regulated permease PerM
VNVIEDLPSNRIVSADGSVSSRWQRLAVIGVAASAAVFVGGAVWQIVGVLAPVLSLFFGGWLLAIVLEPLVGRIMRHAHLRRPTALVVTYLIIVLVSALVWPWLTHGLQAGLTRFPSQVDVAAQQAVGWQSLANAWFLERGVAIQLDVASRLSLDNLALQLRVPFESAMASPLPMVNAAFGVLGSVATMLLLSVFFLLGGAQLADQLAQAFGGRGASDVRFVLTTVHDAFQSFIRAQLVQGVLFGAGVWACLAAVHVDTAPLVGLASGALLLVPVLGAVLAVLVPLVATVLWNPTAILIVAAALVLLEQLVLNVLGPRLMSKQLGLPPLLVFFGVLAGGQVAGVWGAVFGIPVLAALLACLEHFRPRW